MRFARRLPVAAAVLFAALGPPACSEGPPGVAVGAEIVEARKVEWDEVADRCTGSRPGGRIAPGYLVTMTVEGEVLEFFVNAEQAQMCGTRPGRPAGARPIADPELGALADQASSDLAARLGIPADRIQVRNAERVIWRDSSVGCPRAGQSYAQVLTEGARVVLIAGGRAYSYHQAAGAPPFLCESPSGLEPLPAHEIE